MAKPIIKFSAVPYQVGSGTQIRTGLRPQLEPQNGIYDLDFCKEVVTEKRLAMSADELLHAMEMVGEVGPAKVASDGRPRGITKLLKFNRYAQGNLESPTSAWNDSCKAYVRAQLMWDAEKIIDASFQNVLSGVGVRINYVAWVGAQEVTNVVKIGKQIGVYGNHMEFIAGDTAKLIVGTAEHTLTCTESDVAHAVFNWPAGVAPEAGTEATFLMTSRGGVAEGEVYTSKKAVMILAADPVVKPETPVPMTVANEGGKVPRAGDLFIAGGPFEPGDDLSTASFKFTAKDTAGNLRTVALTETAFEFAGLESGQIRLAVSGSWTGEHPWGSWVDYTQPCTISLRVERTAKIDIGSVTATFADPA